jgi:hypothetical protein
VSFAPEEVRLIRVISNSTSGEGLEAHLTIMFAALAVSQWDRRPDGLPIKRFVRTARPLRTIQVHADAHTPTAVDLLPDDLRNALDHIHRDAGVH